MNSDAIWCKLMLKYRRHLHDVEDSFEPSHRVGIRGNMATKDIQVLELGGWVMRNLHLTKCQFDKTVRTK
jgi:hypothetical protein